MTKKKKAEEHKKDDDTSSYGSFGEFDTGLGQASDEGPDPELDFAPQDDEVEGFKSTAAAAAFGSDLLL